MCDLIIKKYIKQKKIFKGTMSTILLNNILKAKRHFGQWKPKNNGSVLCLCLPKEKMRPHDRDT